MIVSHSALCLKVASREHKPTVHSLATTDAAQAKASGKVITVVSLSSDQQHVVPMQLAASSL